MRMSLSNVRIHPPVTRNYMVRPGAEPQLVDVIR